ncbi:hypothetical protein A9K55_006146 [Cordyceps militaris]|uniref:Uncharacterized protein n=1 Tax=Cordyceps militaris TaxID=73501 RepID=A0A2H4SAQ9_CORMI|nr:hypothetical protein A9K55_006146 [Cordyceps militaris]
MYRSSLIPNPKQNADKTNSHILSATSKQTDKQQDNRPSKQASREITKHSKHQCQLANHQRPDPATWARPGLLAHTATKRNTRKKHPSQPHCHPQQQAIRFSPWLGYTYHSRPSPLRIPVLPRVRYDTNLSSILPPPVPIKPPALREPSWPIASGRFRQCSIPTSQCPSPRGRLR